MVKAGAPSELTALGIYGKEVEKGLRYLENLAGTPEGVIPGGPAVRVDIDGDDIFALFRRYETVEAQGVKLESHRKYIDVQYLLEGEEIIGLAVDSRNVEGLGYDREKDVEFFEGEGEGAVLLKTGQCAVFLPGELHAPGIMGGKPAKVCKVVVKVKAGQIP